MTLEIGHAEALERFRAVLTHRLGLVFDGGRDAQLSDLLQRRRAAAGLETGAYLARLDSSPATAELTALARELTVAETYFFRHLEQMRAFTAVLPARMAARGTQRRLRVLSLACASGEEPYSLAMLLRDAVPDESWDVSIVAVDVNPDVLDKARRGRYFKWSMRETPEPVRARWFRTDRNEFEIAPALRTSVRFEEGNLADADAPFWQAGDYDIVFCRNVLMYFSPAQARAVVARIERLLVDGGFLFLGHAETLRGLSSQFDLQHAHGAFYYRRKPGPVMGDVRGDPPALEAASLCEAARDTGTWIDAIQRASARVVTLTDAQRPAAGASPRAVHTPAWDSGLVLELLHKERYEEALAIVEALPPESARDPDVLLLRAVLLAHAGRFDAADRACGQLLDVDPLSAGARYLLALCREGAGDPDAAAAHDRAAAYLDAGFAMPRLHLGLLLRRAGDRDGACRELSQALALLQREEASRVLLFGGGFSREALMTLCRAELARCGGQP